MLLIVVIGILKLSKEYAIRFRTNSGKIPLYKIDTGLTAYLSKTLLNEKTTRLNGSIGSDTFCVAIFSATI